MKLSFMKLSFVKPSFMKLSFVREAQSILGSNVDHEEVCTTSVHICERTPEVCMYVCMYVVALAAHAR